MKRRCFFTVVFIVIGLLVLGINKKSGKEFEIVNSYKIESDNFQSVTLQVVVHVWNYDEEELINKIKDYYCKMNGKPDNLKVNLYKSKAEFFRYY